MRDRAWAPAVLKRAAELGSVRESRFPGEGNARGNDDERQIWTVESAKMLKFFWIQRGIAILVVLLAVEVLFLVRGR